MYRNRIKAFTIIELSIVIIIISLIIGGIIVGGEMIAASRAGAVIQEVEAIKSAILNFYGQYGQIPGDMTNATSIFGATDANGNTVTNGNGDGTICHATDTSECVTLTQSIASAPDMQEVYSSFQEMALAGYLKGTYNGAAFGTANYSAAKSLPLSDYGGAIYWFNVWDYWVTQPHSHKLLLTSSKPTGSGQGIYDSAIKSSDAFAIDSKVDDGKPFTGNYMSLNHTNGLAQPLCVNWPTNNVSYPSLYNAYLISNPAIYTKDSSLCTMIFKINNI